MSDINDTSTSGDRLQKIIAQAGIASRRDAEELIRDGKVTVNGKTAKLGDKATLGQDSIKVKGKLINTTEAKAYYLIYKPKNVLGMITEDEEGRPTLFEYTRRVKERVFTVGRMDFTGEGIILLTNDGEIAQKMQKANDIIRRYHVKVDRHPTPVELEKLARGGRIEGRSMHPYHVRLADAYNKNSLIEISFEGLGAIDIRKFFENKGFYPERIACVGIGHIAADKMVPGEIKRVEGSSIQALFTQPELATKLVDKLKEKKVHIKKIKDDQDSEASSGDRDVIAPAIVNRQSKAKSMPFGPSAVDEAAGTDLPNTRSLFARTSRTSAPAARTATARVRPETRKTDAYAPRGGVSRSRTSKDTGSYAARKSSTPARGASRSSR